MLKMHWKTYEHSQHRIIDHLCAQSERDIVMLLARSGNEKGLVEIFKHYKRDMDCKAILAKIEERHSVNGNMTRSNKVCDSMQQLVQLFMTLLTFMYANNRKKGVTMMSLIQ
jgi:hypothetical protein